MSDAFWMSLFTFVGILIGIYKMFSLDAIAQDTHKLVNSNMALQLRLHAVTARRLASITGDAADIGAAEVAERLLKEHEDKEEYRT